MAKKVGSDEGKGKAPEEPARASHVEPAWYEDEERLHDAAVRPCGSSRSGRRVWGGFGSLGHTLWTAWAGRVSDSDDRRRPKGSDDRVDQPHCAHPDLHRLVSHRAEAARLL